MSAPVLPAYGYAHHARVVRVGEADNSYLVEVPAIAPGILSGPFTSAIRDLQSGDQVLVLQVGPTSGDLVIICRLPERPPEFTLPIEISDVTGLAAALDNRATDAELAALQSATNLNFLVVNDKNTEQDGRLTAVESLNTTQNGRLTAVESLNTAQDGRLTTNEAAIAANATAVTEANTWRPNQDHDVDVYGDAVHFGLPAAAYQSSRSLNNSTAYLARTRVRRSGNISIVRVAITVVGTGAGTTTAALFRASSATGAGGPYTPLGSGSSALASTGIQSIAIGAQTLAAGDWLALLLIPVGYTAPPTHAAIVTPTSAGLINRSTNNVRSAKAMTTPPATVSPGDGTWGAQTQLWYCALA
jgi:hypothetical protein